MAEFAPQILSFLGIRNTSPARSIPNNALVAADDVDLDNAGAILQRNGFTEAAALANTTAYSTVTQEAYVVSNGMLYQVGEGLTLKYLAPSTAKAFYDYGGTLFTDDGLCVFEGAVKNFKLLTPENPPVLTTISGSLPAGRYSAVYVYVDATGLESGTSPNADITLGEGQSIAFENIAPSMGYRVKWYVTEAGGEVYYDEYGVPLDTEQLVANPFPSDISVLAYFDSCIYAATPLATGHTLLRWSAPFYYHWWDYEGDQMLIPGEIRAMASNGQMLVIGTDSEIYGLSQEGLARLAPYGVPPGRAFARTAEGVVYMHTYRGVCASPHADGSFVNLTQKKVSLPAGASCSTAIVEQGGIRRFVALTDGSGEAYNARV